MRSERLSVSNGAVRERVSAPPRWRTWLSGESNESAAEGWIAPGGQGVLAVHHLGKGYRGRMVVQDVSLSVRRGEAVGLLGALGFVVSSRFRRGAESARRRGSGYLPLPWKTRRSFATGS